MKDFRIPIKIFKEYSQIMKGLNKECQNSFLNAMGVDVSYAKSKIAWEKFISLNCLLRFNTATLDEYINFFVKVFDPFNRGMVPRDQFEETLHSLFKGQFQLKGDDGRGGVAADIRRGLLDKGLVTEAGELDIKKFR